MRLFAVISLVLFASTGNAQENFRPELLKVEWETIENFHKGKNDFLGAFTLTNLNSEPLPASGWSIFFNFPRRFKEFKGGIKVEQVNGDFFRMFPTAEFTGIQKGETKKFELVGGAWATNLTDIPAGVYLVWDKERNKGIPLANFSVRPSTTSTQLTRYATDNIPQMTSELVYSQNQLVDNIETNKLTKIFPTPSRYSESGGSFQMKKADIGYDPAFQKEADYLTQELITNLIANPTFITRAKPDGQIRLIKNKLPEEAYELTVNEKGITIAAGTRSGIFYGIQSLKSLIAPHYWKEKNAEIKIPFVTVSDTPRFPHRAFMLDVARNFQTKEQIFKTLDLMALYKMNVFHFHFNDDEGWRLEIPGLPELTEVGGRRGHGWKDSAWLHPSYGSGPSLNSHGSGFYTRKDFIEILKYAKARHIKVIPEVETPGHARAAVASMEHRYRKYMAMGDKQKANEYRLYDPADSSMYRSAQSWHRNVMNVAMPSTLKFVEKITDELLAMYKEAHAPIETIHFGGDEVPNGVWERSPVVQQLIKKDPKIKNVADLWYYFYHNVSRILEKRGLFLYGWEEIAMRKTKLDGRNIYIPNPDFTTRNFQVDVWNNVIGWGSEDLPYKLANAGYKVVLSPVTNVYLDLAYQKNFYEQGHYWGGYLDIDKPFRFIPFDYYKNATHDINGNVVTKTFFDKKERLTDYGRENIVGIQGLLWAETLTTPQRMEYMMLPKLLAVAERAWAKDPSWATERDSTKAADLYNQDWSAFLNVVGKRELPRLDYYKGGFQYRIPTPGAIVKDGSVHVNAQFPGFIIRYTTDGSEPNVNSRIYQGPLTEKGQIKTALFAGNGRTGRSVTVANP
jgi:hexosaminidase